MKEKSLIPEVRSDSEHIRWVTACRTEDVPENGAACIKYDEQQIAIFHLAYCKAWFATQNLCPHKQQMTLYRGITGDAAGEPKVACPFHKKTFSLRSGACISDPGSYALKTYPVKIRDGCILIGIQDD